MHGEKGTWQETHTDGETPGERGMQRMRHPERGMRRHLARDMCSESMWKEFRDGAGAQLVKV